jgi:hypothetical protein
VLWLKYGAEQPNAKVSFGPHRPMNPHVPQQRQSQRA